MAKNTESKNQNKMNPNDAITGQQKEKELPKNPLPQPKDYEEIEY